MQSSLDTRNQRRTIRVRTSFVRPNDATPYTAKDEISNDTDQADALYLTFPDVAQSRGYGGRVVGATFHSSQDSPTNAAFDLLLFDAPPTMVGDNAEFDMPDGDADNYLGTISILAAGFGEFKDTKGGYAAALGRGIGFVVGSVNAIYGVLVARGAYTPAALEAIGVALDIEQD